MKQYLQSKHPSEIMDEDYNGPPTGVPEDAEQIHTTGSGLSGGSGVFSGLSGMSDLEGEPLAHQPSTDAESFPSVIVQESRSMEETGSHFTGRTVPSPTSPRQFAHYAPVSPVLSSPGRAMSPYSAKVEASESGDNMSMPPLPGEPSLTSTGSYPGVGAATAQAHQPSSPTHNSRRTSDAATKAQIGHTGTITPGAVAVQPSQPVPTPQPAGVSLAQQDAMAKARGARPSRRSTSNEAPQPMIAPGAVAVQPSQPMTTPQPAAMSQAEEDAMAKARGARPSRRSTHNEAPQPMSPMTQPVVTQTQLDAEAKARARGSTGVSVTPGMGVDPTQVDDSGAMDEMARRREERAQARAERLGVQSSSVGAVSVSSTQPTRESRKMERGSISSSPRSVAGTASTTPTQANTNTLSNMSEEERQRRFDTKMAEAKLQKQDTQNQESQPNNPSTSENGMVISNKALEERERRYDMKMSQFDQQHSDNREKRGTAAGPEVDGYVRGQPTSMRSPGNPDKTDDYDIMDSSMPAIPAADRGAAVGSDVEYGQPLLGDNELAVAIAIDEEEEEEEKFYAYAVEYDPDSKPPLYQNRRCRLYCIMATVFLIVLVVLLSVTIVVTGNGSDGNSGTEAPTVSPTTERENIYRKQIADIVGDKIYEPGTPHNNAINWIVNEDPMQMEASDQNLMQRFMMAFLYFHTSDNGNKPWTSCNPPKEGEDDTCVGLQFARQPDDSVEYIPRDGKFRWLSGKEECSWYGVLCEGGNKILGFNLIGFNLTGTLPTELAALPLLQSISMPFNLLSGTIPPEYAKLRNLIQLELHGNTLTGSIPVEFFDIGSLALQNFNVGENMLSGTLDTRIGLMTDLKGLHIFQNNFVGSFPSEVANLNSLSFIRVHENEFAGPLPTVLGNLWQVSEFMFDDNRFSGTIPSELGQLSRLQFLFLAGNNFTGTIPDELYSLSRLKTFELQQNSLTGTLSTLIGQLTDLINIIVSNNELTGTIPSEIANIPTLEAAWFHRNLFTGAVPTDICYLPALGGLQADCHPVGNEPNPCLCCIACCDREGDCVKNDLTSG